MDDITEDTLPDRCIILSPEELAKLGVKLDPSASTSCQKNDLNPKCAKEQPIEQSVDKANNTQYPSQYQSSFASCSQVTKVIRTYQRKRPQASLNPKEIKIPHQQTNIGNDKHNRKILICNNTIDKSLIDSKGTMNTIEDKTKPEGEIKSSQNSSLCSVEPKNIHFHSSPDLGKKVSSIDIVLPKQENIDIVTRKSQNYSNTTDKGYCSKEVTKNRTEENSELFDKDNIAEEQVKLSLKCSNNSASCSDLKIEQSPAAKRGRPKKSLPLVAKNSSIHEGVCNDHNLEVKHYQKCYKGKNKADSSEQLPSSEICRENSPDDSGGVLDSALVPGCSKTSDTGIQKRKRGRPKKSVSNVLHLNVNDGNVDILNSSELPVNKTENVSDTFFKEGSEIPQNIKTKKRGKGRINKTVDSDVSFNSDSSDDSDSEPLMKLSTKKKRKGRNRRLTNSDASFEGGGYSSNDEFTPKQKHSKIGNSTTESIIQNDVSMLEHISNESLLPEKNTAPRKRGRPKKNSLEANKTVSSPALVQESKIDESIITTSIRGRKRKEINYSLLENPDCSEPRRSAKISLRQQLVHYDSPHNNKIEAEDKPVNKEENNKDVIENCNEMNEVSEDNSNEKQYKWTGNVTKAINQMFSAIKNVSITDSGHDPLLGKTKRLGKSNADLLDKDGSTVCMVCNETIPNPQWPKHKRKVHYNLAWRKGEVCLELSNEEVIIKTLKELIRERSSVKCNRCSEKFKNANKFASHLEVCNGIVNSSGFVTCAVCKEAMEKTRWHYHNYRHHNNLAWREGDPPLDLEDQDSVLRILNGLYKARKPLHCEKCGLQKKSVLGFLSHKSTCQKSREELENMKASCELCGKRILPVSMDYHLKTHEQQKAKSELVNSSYFDVNVDVTGKRRAAKQALRVISSIKGQVTEESKYYSSQCDFEDSFVNDVLRKILSQDSSIKCIFADCHFSTEIVEEIVNHMKSCEKKPNQYFICKVCLSCCEEESEIHEHIRAEHDKSFKEDEDAEFQIEGEQNYSEDDALLDDEERDMKRIRLIGKQKLLNQSNIRIKPYFLLPYKQNYDQILYQHAHRWMLEFCDKNYKFNLYQHLRNDRPWQVLDCDILSNYLPKNTQSCDIAAKIINLGDSPDIEKLTFKKLDLLEVGALYEDDITIYCGGPISTFAWLPTPYNQNTYNQVLAVAVFNSMDTCYAVDKNYHEPCVIQFWDFGILDVHEKNVSKPSLLLGMAVPSGPIWHLEWCPSGCLDCFLEDNTCRLGLLAVAASDSCAYIYSIDNLPDSNDRGFIYKGEPVLKLQLESVKSSLEGQNYYPTRISWSKADGHKYIAVGYSTGLIALYDLQNESLLLQMGNKTGTNIIFPYKTFQAHLSNITALTLSHLSGGNKFLFSASFDRTSLFWDLSTVTKIAPTKRNTIISDGIWLTQWPTYLVAEDESSYNDNARAHSYYRAMRHLMSPENSCFTFASSGINTLSYSDWLNTILHGSNAGEIMMQITNRMFCNIEHRIFKLCYPRSILSITKLVKKESDAIDVAVTYAEAKKKYKVAFLDYNLKKIDNTPNNFGKNKLNEDNLSQCDIREYKLQSVNKVAFNPNPYACSFYAIGYQAGFVRLQWIEFASQLLHTQRRDYS